VRFSAQLGFTIDPDTLKAAGENAEKLNYISAERIRVELNKLLLSKYPDKLIEAYKIGITKIIFPEFNLMMMTEQHNSHHIYSVGIHTIKAIEAIVENRILRWTMLLHDVAKPECKSVGTNGEDTFYQHPEKSAEMAKQILRRLKFDNDTTDTVVRLVKWHNYHFALTPADMRKATNKIGEDIMELLFEVKKADILAQSPETMTDKFTELEQAKQLYYDIKEKKECVNLKMLRINGKDLLELGYRPGIIIGETLNQLLEQVLENPELNEKSKLIHMAKQLLQ
jgi:tRNA nucleotidyltransferase (CCA-adding enzyme)